MRSYLKLFKKVEEKFLSSKRLLSIAHCRRCEINHKSQTYSIVKPEIVSPIRIVPQHIITPDYARTGHSEPSHDIPEIKNHSQIEQMKQACQLAKKVLQTIEPMLKVGVSTDDIDEIAHNFCIKHKAYPSTLNYNGFPKSICTSVNNVVCHGIPDSRKLEDGDILTIDVTVFYNGYHGDVAKTFAIGKVDTIAQSLMNVTKESLYRAIQICAPGVPFNLIGDTISKIVEQHNFSVVPAFCGHGIGEYFHGAPDIFHFKNDYEGEMKEGMTFTIEPAICTGEPDIYILEDNWTAITADDSRTAQYEHTILITNKGAEILTI